MSPKTIPVLIVLLLVLVVGRVEAVEVLAQHQDVQCWTNVPRSECEYENPLTGDEEFNHEHPHSWEDADYIPEGPNVYDDWTVNAPGMIDGCSTEVWLRSAGHVATAQTKYVTTRIFVSLNGDDNDGLADIYVDGQWKVSLDMYSKPKAETIVVLIENLDWNTHVVEVRDMGVGGGGYGGDDVAILGCASLGSDMSPEAKQIYRQGIGWWIWLQNMTGGVMMDALCVKNPRFIPGDDPAADSVGAAIRAVYIESATQLSPQPEPPDSWAQVVPGAWSQEAWYYFPGVPEDEYAPEMILWLAMPDMELLSFDDLSGWYLLDYEIYAAGQQVETGVLEFRSGPLRVWPTQVEDPPSSLRTEPLLEQNIPNPFNPSTKIQYRLEREGPVELSIYDLRGRLVRTLVRQTLPAGPHEALWDGRDDFGRQAASGSYLYVLENEGQRTTRKLVLLK